MDNLCFLSRRKTVLNMINFIHKIDWILYYSAAFELFSKVETSFLAKVQFFDSFLSLFSTFNLIEFSLLMGCSPFDTFCYNLSFFVKEKDPSVGKVHFSYFFYYFLTLFFFLIGINFLVILTKFDILIEYQLFCFICKNSGLCENVLIFDNYCLYCSSVLRKIYLTLEFRK